MKKTMTTVLIVASVGVVLGLARLGCGWLNQREKDAKAETTSLLAEVCRKGDLGEPFVRRIFNTNPQYFCMKPDGRLAHVLMPNQDFESFVGSTQDDQERWRDNAVKACQKAGLGQPRYLTMMGFFCEAQNGELIPVFHPDEITMFPQAHKP